MEKWKFLNLTLTSIVWTRYKTFPFWPGLVRRFNKNEGTIGIQFFPTKLFTSIYDFYLEEEILKFYDMTIAECREILELETGKHHYTPD